MHGRTVLFLGAGRDQRRAIVRAKELGIRVVAVDRDSGASGLPAADVAEILDFDDLEAVIRLGHANSVEAAVAIAVDRAVPVAAAVAEALGLPGIGRDTAHGVTNKIAMRRVLADAGVPQPRFAAARTLHEARAAAETVGFPAVLKPADASRQRGVFRLESVDDLDAHLHATLAESRGGEVIVESYHEGLELNAVVAARGGEGSVVTLSDRLRPSGGAGFGVGIAHIYPATIFGVTLEEAERIAVHAIRALGVVDGIASTQLLVQDGEVLVVEAAARVPGGQLPDLVRHAVGVDIVEIAVHFALGETVPDALWTPARQQPLAVRFLTADPGPLAAGVVRSVGSPEKALSLPGVVQAELDLRAGDRVDRVRTADDRHGYVIATADTNLEALERAEAATRLLEAVVDFEAPTGHTYVTPTSQMHNSG